MTARRPIPGSIVGDFIRLEPLTRDHFPGLQAAIGHPIVFENYGGGARGYQQSIDDFAAWAEHYYPWGVGIPHAVRLIGGAHDGDIVGTSSLSDFDLVSEHAHIGWTAYDPRVWGSQVNAEAKLLLLGHAFSHGFGRVKIQTDVLNEHSRAAIAGIGGTFEGIVRRERPRSDGTWRDTAMFSVIVEDWPDVRARLEERLAAFGGRPVEYRDR